MSIVLQGSTSGSITLQEPAIAGSTVLSLPATTGTVLTSASPSSDLPSSINGPAFSAYKSGSSQSFSSNTSTKITFETKTFDTATRFNNTGSTSNGIPAYAFMPNVAGYYMVTANIEATAFASNYFLAQLKKNGSQWMNGSNFPTSASAGPNSNVAALVYLNGSTDYVELYGQSSASCTITGTTDETLASKFQAVLVRAA